MKNNSVCRKFLFIFLFQCITLVFLVMQTTHSQTYQAKTHSELMQAARIAFSGNVPGQKNGPLAKMGFDLALLREEYRDHTALQTLAPFTYSNSLLHISNNQVVVDVIAQSDAASIESDLKGLGMQITGKAGAMVSGLLPITSLEAVAALQNVRFARPAMWKTNVGLITSQGDSSMHSSIVRRTLGYKGAGIKVGVLSDSYNHLGGAAADVASGDLPGVGNPDGYATPVNVLADDGTTDEGRGMLQIVHDVAPAATLAFATANGGQATFANHIDSLRRVAGANIIVDDVFYYAEPMFQDGVIAQAVDTVVAAGVPYFSAAGNQAQQSYESVWRSGPVLASGAISGGFYGGTTFDFDPGAGVDNMQSFTLNNNQYAHIILQWDSPFASVCAGCPGSSNDLDIYVLNSAGTQVLASSAYDNINGDAVEGVYISNTSGSTATYNIMIVKYNNGVPAPNPDPGFIKYINFGYPQGSLQFATNSSTLYGHANAAGAEAVGAAAYFSTPAYGVNPPVLESFSSAGPTAIRFTKTGVSTSDARADKPEITAPDGVNTTFFGSSDIEPDGYLNFFGTSAAAPHAAAVAALMLNAKHSATPAQIYSKLEATAINIGTPGFDNNSGFGFIQADLAINSLLPVELVSFIASVDHLNSILRWSTATEKNNYGFEIERRKIGDMDLASTNNGSTATTLQWSKASFVSGSGTSNSPKYYLFTDNNLHPGRYAYRIKQIDQDGTFKYSESVEVEIGLVPKILTLSQNYPNPFNPMTTIEFTLAEDSKVSLKVFDMLGREVATLMNGELKAGVLHQQTFDVSKLSSGMYIYRLQTGNKSLAKKLMVLK
jgi:hypothetical protein